MCDVYEAGACHSTKCASGLQPLFEAMKLDTHENMNSWIKQANEDHNLFDFCAFTARHSEHCLHCVWQCQLPSYEFHTFVSDLTCLVCYCVGSKHFVDCNPGSHVVWSCGARWPVQAGQLVFCKQTT